MRPLFLSVAALVFLSSCTIDDDGNFVLNLEPSATKTVKKEEPGSKYYSENHHIYVNNKIIDSLKPSNAKVEINLGDQRARVYKSSDGVDQLAIETQISTGKEGHNTPDGTYKILEKKEKKKSNLYGTWVDSDSGATLVKDGDSREPPNDPDAEFKGTPMPYWLRVTPGGVGMHIGFVPSFPASHGCIRVPNKVQPLIFSKVRVGTPVKITH